MDSKPEASLLPMASQEWEAALLYLDCVASTRGRRGKGGAEASKEKAEGLCEGRGHLGLPFAKEQKAPE